MDNDGKWLVASAAAALAAAAALVFPQVAPAWPFAAVSAIPAAAVWILSRRFAAGCAALFFAVFAVAGGRVDSAARELDALAVGRPGKCAEYEFAIPSVYSYVPPGEGKPGWFSFRASKGALSFSVNCSIEPGDEIPAPGEKWRLAGWLERARGLKPWQRRALWVRGRGSSMERLSRAGRFSPQAFSARARKSLYRRATAGLENMPEAAGLVRAVLFGDRKGISRDSRDAFAVAGTIHVFAISGLHVMVLAKLLQTVFCVCGIPLRAAACVALPLTWLYACFVGAPPSAVRAAAMASFYYGSWTCWRRPDAIASWSQTLVAFSLAAPETLGGTGCILSFAVMLSLALWSRFAGGCEAFVPLRAGGTAAAWLAGAPVVACAFGRFSPGALFANIAAIPAVCAAFTAGILGVAASFASEPVSRALNAVAGLAMSSLAGFSRLFASVPAFSFEVDPWPLWMCAAWYAALAAAFVLIARRSRKLSLSNYTWSL